MPLGINNETRVVASLKQVVSQFRLRFQRSVPLSLHLITLFSQLLGFISCCFFTGSSAFGNLRFFGGFNFCHQILVVINGPVTPQEITDFSVLGQALAGGGFTYGLYENDGDSHLFGTGNRDGLWLNYEWDYGTTFNRSYEGVYLIADSHSVSIDQAAINSTMSAYNASSPVAVGVFSLFGLALFRRQKKKDT